MFWLNVNLSAIPSVPRKLRPYVTVLISSSSSSGSGIGSGSSSSSSSKRISAFLSHLTSLNDSIVLGTSDIQAYRTRTLTSTHN